MASRKWLHLAGDPMNEAYLMACSDATLSVTSFPLRGGRVWLAEVVAGDNRHMDVLMVGTFESAEEAKVACVVTQSRQRRRELYESVCMAS